MSENKPKSLLWELLCKTAQIDPDQRGALDAMHAAHPVGGRGTYQRIQEGSSGLRTGTVNKLAKEFGLTASAIMAALQGDPHKTDDQGSPYVAHGMSHPFDTLLHLSSGELSKMERVPRQFVGEVPDDGLKGYKAGEQLVFDSSQAPKIGKVVLVRSASGELMLRGYAEGLAPGRWTAQATAPGYLTKDSEEHGLAVLAVAVTRWPLDGLDM